MDAARTAKVVALASARRRVGGVGKMDSAAPKMRGGVMMACPSTKGGMAAAWLEPFSGHMVQSLSLDPGEIHVPRGGARLGC